MNTIQIRQAVLADLAPLALLFDGYRQFYGRASDVAGARAFLTARFEHGESVLFIAHDSDHTGEHAVGFAQLYPSFSSVSLGRIYILNDLFVSESGRRKGVGSQLLAASVAFAQAVGAIRLALSTAHNNARAQALYEAEGWQRDDDVFYVHTLPSLPA
jgi:GNAT superfamily N-acetyltransferase